MAQHQRISTHAPTQGATAGIATTDFGILNFNPRPHTGGDGSGKYDMELQFEISTHAPTQGATI